MKIPLSLLIIKHHVLFPGCNLYGFNYLNFDSLCFVIKMHLANTNLNISVCTTSRLWCTFLSCLNNMISYFLQKANNQSSN